MIAIPNMDKPKICGECPLFIDHCCFDGNEWHNGCFSLEREIFEDELAPDCPLIDIVTCKECKWWNEDHKTGGEGLCENNIFGWSKPTDFCSYGERRE